MPKKKKSSAATLKWRENNPEKYKEYMRNYMKKKRAEKEDLNVEARAVLKKRVPVAKTVVEPPKPAPASVFSLLKSKLAKKDDRGPMQVKKPTQKKGGES